MADVHAETTTPRTTGASLALAPPIERIGALRWLRENLFSSPLNTVLTLLCLWLLWETVPPILSWALFDATFAGNSRADCTGEGACWVFVKVRFGQFLYGFYPIGERWRINTAFLLLVLWAIPLFLPGFRYKIAVAASLLFVYPIVAFYLFYGGAFGLRVVETPLWGGLFLTLVIAGVGITASLPLGILFALGRRSNMPVVRMLSVGFIELVRAVPLITVLFMASVMLPLFLPAGVNFDKLLRALVGVSLFSAAYMAEVVRGGLQAIPKGQYEAASALGLSYWKTMGLVVLPQALRIVIPGIVNTFIGLFKDTTLVAIVGIFDLIRTIEASRVDPNWAAPTINTTGYAFAAIFYFIFCWGMSRYSIAVERRLAAGQHR
jgi:general L-amino acid transport system permease protein